MSLNDIMIKFIHKMDRHLRKIMYTIHHACIKMHAFITFLYFDSDNMERKHIINSL